MKQGLVKWFGGQTLANFAARLSGGEYGIAWARRYRWLQGRKRWIGLAIYLVSYTAAATATALGGCVTPEAAVVGACAWVVWASRIGVWAGWGVSQLGILDYDARVLPKGGYSDLFASTGHQALVVAVVVGTGLIARALHVPAEVMDTFEQQILWTVLGHVGIVGVSTATRKAIPTPQV